MTKNAADRNDRSRLFFPALGFFVLSLLTTGVWFLATPDAGESDDATHDEHGAIGFEINAAGIHVPVDADGLPIVAAREPRYAGSIEQLVGSSTDVVVGIVDSVTATHSEGYPQPSQLFFDVRLAVKGGKDSENGKRSVTVGLNNVQSPNVDESWPPVGTRVMAFVVPDSTGRSDVYELVSSQGLFVVGQKGRLNPTVSDDLQREIRGQSEASIQQRVRSIQADITSGKLQLPEVDEPQLAPLGSGDDPAAEAERYATEVGDETEEP